MAMEHDLGAAIRCLHEGMNYARTRYWYARRHRRLGPLREAAFAAYLNQSPRGLHIGASDAVLEKWFNTDLEPHSPGVYYLDASLPFPFPDHCFDFIFSEHMIEHIPFPAALHLLSECRRVLKPSGVIRIATPNLRNIVSLITAHDAEKERYLDWAVETFHLPSSGYPKSPMVVNNFFRSWGHQFLYEPETLQEAMAQSGFCNIVQEAPGRSSRPFLQNLERHGGAIGDWINQFETMVFEAAATAKAHRASAA
jgi:predicted SAM-dependent methyltransferase